MTYLLVILCLAFATLGSANAQVRIHDAGVRLLAKPFGIEKRIELESIDGLYSSSDGQKRLKFTLRNSGVKEVTLKQPRFSLDIVLADGRWVSLGKLLGCGIVFPRTGDTKTTDRTYVARLESPLTCSDIESYLRDADAASTRIRLAGRADMEVGKEGRTEFSKKNLKLELLGTTVLAPHFRRKTVGAASALPTTGKQ